MNIGNLGLGAALGNSLSGGLTLADKYADYQMKRYTDPAQQVRDLSEDEAAIFKNRADTIYNANTAADLDRRMQIAARNETQAAQAQQGAVQQGAQQQVATNAGAIANALNQSVYAPQPAGVGPTVVAPAPYAGPMQQGYLTPEQMGTQFRDLLQQTGGDPRTSLAGVLSNGY